MTYTVPVAKCSTSRVRLLSWLAKDYKRRAEKEFEARRTEKSEYVVSRAMYELGLDTENDSDYAYT